MMRNLMVEADDNSEKAILDSVKNENFYATQGPEVHMWIEGDEAVVRCSPVFESHSFPTVYIAKSVRCAGLT